MKYLVVGMGGVGASITERLVSQGNDVSVIARGEHLKTLQKNGLHVARTYSEDTQIDGFFATTAEDYNDMPEVIFVCVKEYSIESIYPLLERCCTQTTTVIPLLNVYGTGQKISAYLKKNMGEQAPLCTDGCIYVAAMLTGPGTLLEHSPLCRIFFGLPGTNEQPKTLHAISNEASGSKLECILSDRIERDAYKKFSYVSPMGATAIIHGSNVGDIQSKQHVRATFIDAMHEALHIGACMGIDFGEDMISANLSIADSLSPDSSTSLQRDLETGHQSEFDGLINEVIRWGEKYHVPTPTYLLAKEQAHDRFGV